MQQFTVAAAKLQEHSLAENIEIEEKVGLFAEFTSENAG